MDQQAAPDGVTAEDAESSGPPTAPRVGHPRIVAVIPALNEAKSIEKVVRGLREQTSLLLDDVIVVDNGSD